MTAGSVQGRYVEIHGAAEAGGNRFFGISDMELNPKHPTGGIEDLVDGLQGGGIEPLQWSSLGYFAFLADSEPTRVIRGHEGFDRQGVHLGDAEKASLFCRKLSGGGGHLGHHAVYGAQDRPPVEKRLGLRLLDLRLRTGGESLLESQPR